jgi:hypothetical protein
MSVVFLKLLSGEEIIGELCGDEGGVLLVADPLAMESGVDADQPGRRYVYMSRFAPYSAAGVVGISKVAVAIVTPVSDPVLRYYTVSLDYCKKTADPKFEEGLVETTASIQDMLGALESHRAKKPAALAEELMEKFLLAAAVPSANGKLH